MIGWKLGVRLGVFLLLLIVYNFTVFSILGMSEKNNRAVAPETNIEVMIPSDESETKYEEKDRGLLIPLLIIVAITFIIEIIMMVVLA